MDDHKNNGIEMNSTDEENENVQTSEIKLDTPAIQTRRIQSTNENIRRSTRIDILKSRIIKAELKNNTINSTPTKKYDKTESSEDSEQKVFVEKPTTLFDVNEDVAGQNLYSFRTPKKKDGMSIKASNTPKTPKLTSSTTKMIGTPKTPKLSSRITKTPGTPKTPKSASRKLHTDVLSLTEKTPRHVRSKLKRELLQRTVSIYSDVLSDDDDYIVDSSSSDGDDSSTVESSDEEMDTSNKINIKVPILPRTTSSRITRSRSQKQQDFVLESDGYFSHHSNKKAMTSDHTLDRLKTPRLPHEDLFSLLAAMKLTTDHEKAVTDLQTENQSNFDKWLFILNEGFSILLYGLGSKRNLLQTFHTQMLSKQTVLVVNGFFPGLTIKDVLDSITNDILELKTESKNLHEIVDEIEEELKSTEQTLFLIVHNIDGVMLRNHKAQLILSRLAKILNVHLLASIDHINTPLLWDYVKLNNFNFSWWDATSMLPYTDETAFENSMLIQNSGSLALSSMQSVFSSLTSNSRGIYLIIVKYQIENMKTSHFQGILFKDLYGKCREAFLVSSDVALRAQLTEFLDHQMVKSKRAADGTEHLIIPISNDLLQQFLDQQHD